MTSISPALLTETTDPEPYLANDAWCAEEKLNGRRMLLVKRGDVVRAYSRNGNEYVAPLGVVKRMQLSGCNLVLDGELVGETFTPFDVLWIGGNYVGSLTFWNRRPHLTVYSPFESTSAWGDNLSKLALFDKVKCDGGEGIVFKRKDSIYQLGQRSYGVKFKFYQTVTADVLSVDMSKCTIGVTPQWPATSSVTVRSISHVAFDFNKTWPKVGELWEVRYDEISANGKLMRPRLLHRRDDLE